jgi:hypothetical protein
VASLHNQIQSAKYSEHKFTTFWLIYIDRSPLAYFNSCMISVIVKVDVKVVVEAVVKPMRTKVHRHCPKKKKKEDPHAVVIDNRLLHRLDEDRQSD